MSLLPKISQASAEINKLVAQANIHQTIAPVDPAAFTDPADTTLLASRDPVIREVSVGMTGEAYSDYSVSGTPPLSLPNSLGKPLKAWSVDLSPYQEGTGDPAPDNVRPIHGTDKLNMFVEESYDQSATPKAVITLPQAVYTGTIGSDGGECRWGEVDLGDLAWIYYSQNNVFYALVTDKAFGGHNEIMCEQYKPSTTTGFNLSDYEISVGASNSYVYVKDPRYTTASDFKTAVSGVKLVYPLATPTTFSVPSVTIPTPTGTATTWATAEDGTIDGMEVTYVGKA